MRTIAVAQLPSHLELSQLLKYCMGDLVALRLTYGALHCGMDYERSLFGMTLGDVASLAAQLPLAETLSTLDLTNSVIDDEKMRALQKGLAENNSVTALVLANNRLADRRARADTEADAARIRWGLGRDLGGAADTNARTRGSL